LPLPAPKITWPLHSWRQARKIIAKKPRRNILKKVRTSKGEPLPWQIPKPQSADARMWEDYQIFKAAGLLNEWFDLYRDVLNLEPQHTQAAP